MKQNIDVTHRELRTFLEWTGKSFESGDPVPYRTAYLGTVEFPRMSHPLDVEAIA